jgi:hypothetical protein
MNYHEIEGLRSKPCVYDFTLLPKHHVKKNDIRYLGNHLIDPLFAMV